MIRVLVVEEVRAICETVAAALRSEPDMEVIGCATSLAEALPRLRVAEVALVNTSVSGDGSASLIRTIRTLAPRV